MRRREVIAGLALGVAMGRARAQRAGRVYRIALVSPANPLSYMTATGIPQYRAFLEELARQGFVEGRNLIVERYSGNGRVDQFPDIVRKVVGSDPDVIWTLGDPLVLLFKAATTSIPIVCAVNDPVSNGFVGSLAHPGGNITGITVDTGLELYGKYIEFLQQAAGRLTRLGILIARTSWDTANIAAVRKAAEKVGASVIGPSLENYQEPDYRRAFAIFREEGADSVFVSATPANYTHTELIVGLATAFALPAIYTDRSFTVAGGLISYGFDLPGQFRKAAGLVGKVLKGANPGDLPVEQPTRLELVINLKTANALGLTIPPLLFARADEIIE